MNPKYLKTLLFALWMGIVGAAIWGYIQAGIPLQKYPELIRNFIAQFGFWGPILYIIVYAIRPIIFFPATLLTLVSGLLFVPFIGILYTIVGENLSANFAFLIGRYFGQSFIGELKAPWIQKINVKLEQNGFMTTLLMRLLYFPFDLTNYSCGMSKMKHRDYALATFVGILPGLTTFVLLGGAAGSALGFDGENASSFKVWIILGLSLITFLFSLILSKWLKTKHLDISNLKD